MLIKISLILVSMIVAIKYNEDTYYLMSFYAQRGGSSLNKLLRMESTFLNLIDYRLYVKQEKYYEYEKHIIRNLIK